MDPNQKETRRRQWRDPADQSRGRKGESKPDRKVGTDETNHEGRIYKRRTWQQPQAERRRSMEAEKTQVRGTSREGQRAERRSGWMMRQAEPSRAEPRVGCCLSSPAPPECSAAPAPARPSNAPGPSRRSRHTRSASRPARALLRTLAVLVIACASLLAAPPGRRPDGTVRPRSRQSLDRRHVQPR